MMIALLFAAAAAAPALAPGRHMEFAYTVSNRSESYFTGTRSSKTSDLVNNDNGTIGVDVLGMKNDAMVVRVSERSAYDRRRFVPQTCQVFSDTRVDCGGAESNISYEARELLRTLGESFFDPSRLDANAHWRVAVAGSYMMTRRTADFTVLDDANGIAKIRERADTQRLGPEETTTDGTIVYDIIRRVPRSLHEDAAVRTSADMSLKTSIDLQIRTDSVK